MTNDSAWDWAKRHGCEPLHVNNGTRGLIGVRLRGQAFVTQYDDGMSPETAFVLAVQSAQLEEACRSRHRTGD